MNKRSRRLSTLSGIVVIVATSAAWNATVAAQTPAELAWRLEAVPIGSSNTMFRDVRLVSPTTYVRAARATIEGTELHATDATVYAKDWRLSAADLSLDLRLDKVEITTPRTDAHPE